MRGFGVHLRSATEAIGPAPADRLTENVIAAIAYVDNDTKALRIGLAWQRRWSAAAGPVVRRWVSSPDGIARAGQV